MNSKQIAPTMKWRYVQLCVQMFLVENVRVNFIDNLIIKS